MTSRVMAMASTPSLKASSRVLVTVLSVNPAGGAPESRVLGSPRPGSVELPGLLDHLLIIQTIRRDLSRPDGIDEVSNASRLDPSGAVQVDAEHPSPNRTVMGPRPPRFGMQVRGDPTGRDRFAVTDGPGTPTSSAEVTARGRPRLLVGRLQPAQHKPADEDEQPQVLG